MWYPVALLGAAFLLQVVAEDPPHNRTKRLTAFGKSPNSETDPKSKLRSLCLFARRSYKCLSYLFVLAPVCPLHNGLCHSLEKWHKCVLITIMSYITNHYFKYYQL